MQSPDDASSVCSSSCWLETGTDTVTHLRSLGDLTFSREQPGWERTFGRGSEQDVYG